MDKRFKSFEICSLLSTGKILETACIFLVTSKSLTITSTDSSSDFLIALSSPGVVDDPSLLLKKKKGKEKKGKKKRTQNNYVMFKLIMTIAFLMKKLLFKRL